MSPNANNIVRINASRARMSNAEREFLPAALEIIETPASPVGRAVGGVIVFACLVAVLWASIGKVDIIASATGRVIPVGRVKTVQPFQTGVVTAINVNDGDHVLAGQALIEMDPTQAQADHDQYIADLVRAQLDLARLRGLQASFTSHGVLALVNPPRDASADQVSTALDQLQTQAAAQQAKLAAFDEQRVEQIGEAAEASAGIAKLQATVPWAQKEVDIRREAMHDLYGNEIAWIQAEGELADQQQEEIVLARHRDQAVAAVAEIARERDESVAEFQRDSLTDLGKAQDQVSELTADLAKAQMQLDLDNLRAPIEGTVESLAVHTVGGVVTPAQPLLLVVPDNAPLVVEANVENRDVGFVHVGQRAELKIETFTFTRYGMIGGKVISLSRDAEVQSQTQTGQNGRSQDDTSGNGDTADSKTPAYVAEISLDRNYMDTETGRLPLSSGMAVTAEIYTGRRPIIGFLLSPVEKLVEEAGHER